MADGDPSHVLQIAQNDSGFDGRADFKAGVLSRIPLGRVGETKDLVGPAIFLCSAAASFVTGQILGVDGGLTATQ